MPADQLIDLRIGNFALTREIGRGGMGTVYLAEHIFIERRKAIKVLSAEASQSSELVRRFNHEAMAASACQHDHIVEILDCGTFLREDTVHHYIEMEYLEGVSLATACGQPSQRRFDVDRAVKIAVYAADALSVAHERGIVHRDLKPENLFLARRGSRHDYLKILDFGIARLTGDLRPGSRTRTGTVLGTPGYMSPEQANGLHPDGKSDVFSLGVVLYRLLAGVVPFPADSLALFLMQVRDERRISLHTLRPDVPLGVSRAVELALRHVPAERPTMWEWKELLLSGDAAPRAIVPELSIESPSSLRHASGPTLAALRPLPVARVPPPRNLPTPRLLPLQPPAKRVAAQRGHAGPEAHEDETKGAPLRRGQ